MSMWALPVIGLPFVLFIVLPITSLIAKLGLSWLEREEAGGPLHALNLRYLLLVCSSLLPLMWFFSAGIHQAAKSDDSALACLLEHQLTPAMAVEICFDSGLFSAAIVVFLLFTGAPLLRQIRTPKRGSSEFAAQAEARINRLLQAHPQSRSLLGKVFITDEQGFTVSTHGWTNLRVYVGSHFSTQLTDEMLLGALGHEREHMRSSDPLRYLVLEISLRLNPLGRIFLNQHATLWRASREAHCDRGAVIRGSAPLGLAEAILKAARPSSTPKRLQVNPAAAALNDADARGLKFRIKMLLAFSERRPVRCCEDSSMAFVACLGLLLVALWAPHALGTGLYDALHTAAEQSISHILQ